MRLTSFLSRTPTTGVLPQVGILLHLANARILPYAVILVRWLLLDAKRE